MCLPPYCNLQQGMPNPHLPCPQIRPKGRKRDNPRNPRSGWLLLNGDYSSATTRTTWQARHRSISCAYSIRVRPGRRGSPQQRPCCRMTSGDHICCPPSGLLVPASPRGLGADHPPEWEGNFCAVQQAHGLLHHTVPKQRGRHHTPPR